LSDTFKVSDNFFILQKMKKILASRFSALGDVAIAVHVLSAVLQQNPEVEILLLTKTPFRQLFENIDRISFFDVDLKEKHKGVFGIKKLVAEILTEHKIDYYADIHDVLRTKLIKFFLPNKIKKAVIDKGRREKKLLTKKNNKKLHQLKHSAERYADVFIKLGLKADLTKPAKLPIFAPSKNIAQVLRLPSPKIGIAPFAAHKSKMYPIEKMEKVVAELSEKQTVLVFGGGQKEKEVAENWEKKHSNVHSVISKYSMKDEIALLNNCKAVITMDSGNMHLASLTKTKIISFWGATHPFLGFTPFNSPDFIVVQKDLSCRPCSVFGNKECYKGTWECLNVDEKKLVENLI
jgi:ADP-heptose:LPS heptosyltransferase